jgi:hypothetical protein
MDQGTVPALPGFKTSLPNLTAIAIPAISVCSQAERLARRGYLALVQFTLSGTVVPARSMLKKTSGTGVPARG